jgi:hypothetical protein
MDQLYPAGMALSMTIVVGAAPEALGTSIIDHTRSLYEGTAGGGCLGRPNDPFDGGGRDARNQHEPGTACRRPTNLVDYSGERAPPWTPIGSRDPGRDRRGCRKGRGKRRALTGLSANRRAEHDRDGPSGQLRKSGGRDATRPVS